MGTLPGSPLEKAVLDYFHELYKPQGFPQASSIEIVRRENTGGGRYVELGCNRQVQLDDGYVDMGGRFIEMTGLPNGMMAVVLVKDRRVQVLEFTVYGGDLWDGKEREWKII